MGEGVKGRSEGKGWGEGVKGRRGEKKGWRKGREDGVRGEEGPCKGSCHLSLPSIQYLPFSVYRTPPVYHQSISSLSPVYRDVSTGRTGHRVGRGARATAATGAAKARISAHATSLSPVYPQSIAPGVSPTRIKNRCVHPFGRDVMVPRGRREKKGE